MKEMNYDTQDRFNIGKKDSLILIVDRLWKLIYNYIKNDIEVKSITVNHGLEFSVLRIITKIIFD